MGRQDLRAFDPDCLERVGVEAEEAQDRGRDLGRLDAVINHARMRTRLGASQTMIGTCRSSMLTAAPGPGRLPPSRQRQRSQRERGRVLAGEPLLEALAVETGARFGGHASGATPAIDSVSGSIVSPASR